MSYSKRYYDTKGFTPYYFAHVMFNVIKHPFNHLRRLEDIFGDTKTVWFMKPFKDWTNL